MGAALSKVSDFDVDTDGVVLKLLNTKKAIMQAAIMEMEMIDLFIVSIFNWLKNDSLSRVRNFNAMKGAKQGIYELQRLESKEGHSDRNEVLSK